MKRPSATFLKRFSVLIMFLALFVAVVPFPANAGALDWLNPMNWIAGLGLQGLALIASMVGYVLILWPASWFLTFSGTLMDVALDISIDGNAYDSRIIPIIDIGWQISRDVATIFLIFFLLAIAIGIILRVGSFGSRQVLVRLILIGLLINFSLPITSLVIDASNVLTRAFRDGIQADGIDPKDLPPIAAQTAYFLGGSTKSVSRVFLQGLNPISALAENAKPDISFSDGIKFIFNSLIATVFGGIVLFVAALVLAALAIMFFVRMVILWILLILSPLAFAAMILPGTQSYATEWRQKLIEQCAFAPAAMFFLYLVAASLSSGFVSRAFGTSAAAAKVGLDPGENFLTGNVRFAAQYIVIILLLGACIVVAKRLGGHAADAGGKVFDWGKKKMIDSGKRVGWRAAGVAAGGALGAGITAVPGVGAALGALGITSGLYAARQKASEARQFTTKEESARFKGMSVHEQADMLATARPETAAEVFKNLSRDDREKLMERLAERDDVDRVLGNIQRATQGGGNRGRYGSKLVTDAETAAFIHDPATVLRRRGVGGNALGPNGEPPAFNPNDRASQGYQRLMDDAMGQLGSDGRAAFVRNRTDRPRDPSRAYYTDYMRRNGELGDFTRDRASIIGGHRVLQDVAQHYNIDINANVRNDEAARRELVEEEMRRQTGIADLATTFAQLEAEMQRQGKSIDLAAVNLDAESVRRRAEQNTRFALARRIEEGGNKELAKGLRESLGAMLFSPQRIAVQQRSSGGTSKEDVREIMREELERNK